jgi:hypothetical protein
MESGGCALVTAAAAWAAFSRIGAAMRIMRFETNLIGISSFL